MSHIHSLKGTNLLPPIGTTLTVVDRHGSGPRLTHRTTVIGHVLSSSVDTDNETTFVLCPRWNGGQQPVAALATSPVVDQHLRAARVVALVTDPEEIKAPDEVRGHRVGDVVKVDLNFFRRPNIGTVDCPPRFGDCRITEIVAAADAPEDRAYLWMPDRAFYYDDDVIGMARSGGKRAVDAQNSHDGWVALLEYDAPDLSHCHGRKVGDEFEAFAAGLTQNLRVTAQRIPVEGDVIENRLVEGLRVTYKGRGLFGGGQIRNILEPVKPAAPLPETERLAKEADLARIELLEARESYDEVLSLRTAASQACRRAKDAYNAAKESDPFYE